ncbi:MAG: formylglycine-generating enzyme family protein [Leptospirillia bacterium]
MSILDNFTGLPAKAKEGEDPFAIERDLLAMPKVPWKAVIVTGLAISLGFCIAHAILLAAKEKNKLIAQTLALRELELKPLPGGGVTIRGDEAVLIPEGRFEMGRDENDATANSDTTPKARRFLPDFYIGRYEVTNAQYAEFVAAEGYIPPPNWKGETIPPKGTENLPVTYVNWEQAQAYAAWRGGRLCDEAEWEKAARGTDGRRFPYGNEYDPSRANIDYRVGRITPVGSFPEGASPYGVQDMMGNLFEWTASRYAPYPGNRDDPGQYAAFTVDDAGNVVIDPDKESFYVVTRGGCWKCDPWSSEVTTRNATRPGYASDFFGVRVCWDTPERQAVRKVVSGMDK